jgi:hypothetical protein
MILTYWESFVKPRDVSILGSSASWGFDSPGGFAYNQANVKHKNQLSHQVYSRVAPALVILAGGLLPGLAQAETCGSTEVGTKGLGALCGQSNGGSDIYLLIQGIANWILGLIAAAAVLVIVISGIQYIVSQGDPGQVKSAKERLTNAVVGLIVLALMFVILKLIGVSQ